MQLANRNNRHHLLDHQHNSSMIDCLAFVFTSDSNSVDVNTETYVSSNIIQYYVPYSVITVSYEPYRAIIVNYLSYIAILVSTLL